MNRMPSSILSSQTRYSILYLQQNLYLDPLHVLVVYVLSMIFSQVKINSLLSLLSVFFSITLVYRKDIIATVHNFNGIWFLLMSLSLSLLHSSLRPLSVMHHWLINLLFPFRLLSLIHHHLLFISKGCSIHRWFHILIPQHHLLLQPTLQQRLCTWTFHCSKQRYSAHSQF